MVNRDDIKIINKDMPEKLIQLAVDVVIASYNIQPEPEHQERAKLIGETFDKEYGSTWHCVVGRNFGSYVIHELGCFLQLQIEYNSEIETVLLYKHGAGDIPPPVKKEEEEEETSK
mmetsp:Transcript_8996/g.13329  ORF Transcript_8996/g.13329 Transcript_8996/m.13329 type:complete len:116 (-) Transcript_8996:95-442(-)